MPSATIGAHGSHERRASEHEQLPHPAPAGDPAGQPTDLAIAQAVQLRPIADVAAEIGIGPDDLEPYGHDVAKIRLGVLDRPGQAGAAKYVLVTAITPTPLGEGKTTTSIGLAQALRATGRLATVALRQPSMGPTFGIKGGAAGGATARSSRWRASTST